MKKFLAVYTGNPGAMARWQGKDDASQAQEMQRGLEAWHKWVADHQASIVELGAPVGKTKRVSPTGIADATNNIAAYTVVQAQSYQAAAELFVDHPHFSIFPGDGVEIMGCMPVPGM
jgi:hypothetical protein